MTIDKIVCVGKNSGLTQNSEVEAYLVFKVRSGMEMYVVNTS